MRYWLKRCPRCRSGDLREERDPYGPYIACVQCGHILSSIQELALLGWQATEAQGKPSQIAA